MTIRRILSRSVKSVDFLCRLERSVTIDTSGPVIDEVEWHSILLFSFQYVLCFLCDILCVWAMWPRDNMYLLSFSFVCVYWEYMSEFIMRRVCKRTVYPGAG